MSGLAGILAGHHAPGVYRWHAAFGPADVRHTVEHAGWRFARVDGVGIEEKSALMDALGSALQAPDHYGRNLDALRDVLRDVDGRLLLLWDEWGPLAHADRSTFDQVTGIFAERSGQATMAVLLRGEGPEVDLPSLD
ncbi:barstar family protein [Nocardioides sp. CER19]|uniref:barstar family protein n=1 Tax=Nocardioides sp. CER19 TaxID=3038538 RepID=UPI00244BDD9B|nr:barstar family protein [Nocardioides sp. CER19]MDH2416722.1 barstar family protein [Nocardioides sp. CER19]